MLQKRYLSLIFFYTKLNRTRINFFIHNYLNVSPLIQKTDTKIGNTAFFFKKMAFIGLALSCLNLSKFYSTKIKSIIFVVWNLIATYTFIF